MSRGTMLLKERAGAVDLSVCLLFNRLVHRRYIKPFFAIISRLGDGVFWYTLMAVFVLLDGRAGLIAALHMGLVGASGLFVYKLIKKNFVRERPFITHTVIQLGARPLDRYSFPSGHTLHAVGFSIIAVAYYPSLAPLLFGFAALVAASRMVLGLHYPSDVLMGVSIGYLIAQLSWPVVAALG